MKFYTFAIAALILATPAALAQTKPDGKGVPIEITADKTLEWHKADLQYVARGNAIVKKGDTTIKADTMTADYHDGTSKTKKKSGSGDIYRMTGIGHVTIDDKGNIARGDKIVYDMDTGLATLTGDDLKMTSPAQTITATERFEYLMNEGKVKAIGNAKLVRENNTLYGDTITALLGTDAEGKKTLDSLDSSGHVKIVTPTEVLTGNHGTYDAKTDKAVITGSVKITRDQNVLTGERAEVDMATNVSRLFGSSIEDGQTGGRVRGVFYPGSEKKPEKDSQ